MAYLLTTPLNDAWGALMDREVSINIPIPLHNSPQNPSAPVWRAFEQWNLRHDASLYSSKGSQPLTVRELEEWTTKLQEMQTLISKLEVTYGQRASNTGGGGGGKVIRVDDINITGGLPWWYWPLRIGAGVGVGYVVYRGLRPKRG
jgi:hypothetical protein